MIWQLTGKLWPGMRSERRRSADMCDINDDRDDDFSLDDGGDDVHVCDSGCPLLADGPCPNDPRNCRPLGGRPDPGGRASLDENKLTAKRARRQSLSSSWGRESITNIINISNNGHGSAATAAAAGGSSPKRRLKPVHSLSIDNVDGGGGGGAGGHHRNLHSPGMFSMKSMWSTSDLMLSPKHQDLETMSKSSSDLLNIPSPFSLGTSSMSNVSGSLGERMHELVRAFSSRTQRCKERISQPPTPSSTSSYDAKSVVSGGEEAPPAPRNRFGSFMPMGSRTSEAFSDPGQGFVGVGHCRFKLPRCCSKFRFPETFESYSKIYVMWLFVVMMVYVYNSTVIPLRAVFPYQTRSNWRYWLVADYIGDFVYLIDIIVFKTRVRFTDNGIVETDLHQTRKHYLRKWVFKLDVLSLLPLDFFYIYVDEPWRRRYAWLRLPRMFKLSTFWEFYARCDQAAKTSAHAIRIIKTMTYMLYLIHIETCAYYAVSEYEGLNTNRWVYNNQGNAYIRCFYLATKTATSIGNNPKPTNTLEYLFMTTYWLSGVFVFALLIGQIRDIVEAAGHLKDTYRKTMDSVLHYMQGINISKQIQDRTREWFLYNWEQSKTIDERSLVMALPKKLQTDLAINVHFNTLSKVQLFQDCERNLLYDLVLKLKPNLFLPGDFVCQKGEVGKEMYIVSQGQVEVVGGENNELVLATLSEGSVFGEISLLAMSGRGNRRTADVRCKGYTNVFTLSKVDFEEAMNEYPEAQKLLKKRAKKLLKENAKKMEKKAAKVVAEEIIRTPNDTPKMVKTVIQVLNPESATAQKLTSSTKRTSTSSDSHHLQVPGPVPKGHRGHHDHAKNNMAFTFNDEQMKPSIRTESYDDTYNNSNNNNHSGGDNDSDENDDGDDEQREGRELDEDDEILVVERIEQDIPPFDINENDVDDLLNDDNDDDEDEEDEDDLFGDRFGSAHTNISVARNNPSKQEIEFFENVMSELRAQDVIGRDARCGSNDEDVVVIDDAGGGGGGGLGVDNNNGGQAGCAHSNSASIGSAGSGCRRPCLARLRAGGRASQGSPLPPPPPIPPIDAENDDNDLEDDGSDDETSEESSSSISVSSASFTLSSCSHSGASPSSSTTSSSHGDLGRKKSDSAIVPCRRRPSSGAGIVVGVEASAPASNGGGNGRKSSGESDIASKNGRKQAGEGEGEEGGGGGGEGSERQKGNGGETEERRGSDERRASVDERKEKRRKKSSEQNGDKRRKRSSRKQREGQAEERAVATTKDDETGEARTGAEGLLSDRPRSKRSVGSQNSDRNTTDFAVMAPGQQQAGSDRGSQVKAADQGEGHSAGLSAQNLGSLVTVGLGGVCSQDSHGATNTSNTVTGTSTSAPAPTRVRKVSTVSLPQLPDPEEKEETAAAAGEGDGQTPEKGPSGAGGISTTTTATTTSNNNTNNNGRARTQRHSDSQVLRQGKQGRAVAGRRISGGGGGGGTAATGARVYPMTPVESASPVSGSYGSGSNNDDGGSGGVGGSVRSGDLQLAAQLNGMLDSQQQLLQQQQQQQQQRMIPPQNQITCAVEIHREKTKTPTTMMAMTEQPGNAGGVVYGGGGGSGGSTAAPSTSTTVATAPAAAASGAGTTAATTSTTTPRNSPAPSTRSPLPHEMYHMRETIV